MLLPATATAALAALTLASSGVAAEPPRYDVPPGYVRCPKAVALNGFFKWASARRTSCRRAKRFMRAYAGQWRRTGTMPRRVRGFACRIRYWRNPDGEVYASRHACARGCVVIRFYGMV